MQRVMQKIFWTLLIAAVFFGCEARLPDANEPQGELSVSSISPAELSSVDQNSNLFVTYSWDIKNYNAKDRYEVEVWLYDTNRGGTDHAVDFELTGASGTITSNYSGRTFYNCILGCVRATALPFRVFYVLVYYPSTSPDTRITLARTRQYIYN